MPDFLSILSKPDIALWLSQGSALVQVILIDLIMAGDNAVAVGLAAAGLAPKDRNKAIFWGLVAAIATRIIFVLLTVQLLNIIGLLVAGGILLLWVSWRMYRELRDHEQAKKDEAAHAAAEATAHLDPAAPPVTKTAKTAKPKTLLTAILLILVADVSMSLDNVLAVAGAAHRHVGILVFGLILSILLMGLAAHFIANVLHKYRWIGYVGVAIITIVAIKMIWEGSTQVYEQREIIWPWISDTFSKALQAAKDLLKPTAQALGAFA